MWKDNRIICFDVETTGLNPKSNYIIELGICVIDKHQVIGTWSHLFDPQVSSLDPKITEITGLTLDDLQGKPLFASVIDKIISLIDKSFCLAAYNMPFDKSFISREFDRVGAQLPEKDWLDPLVWVRNYNGYKNNKLVQACARYGIELNEAHCAGADIEATANLMLKLIERLPDEFSSVIALQDVWCRKQAHHYRSFRKRLP